MRPGYLLGIFIVLFGATTGWFILGSTLALRTTVADTTQRQALSGLYGGAQTQAPMTFGVWTSSKDAKGRITWQETGVAPLSTDVQVDLGLEQRQKGLLWYNTYAV